MTGVQNVKAIYLAEKAADRALYCLDKWIFEEVLEGNNQVIY